MGRVRATLHRVGTGLLAALGVTLFSVAGVGLGASPALGSGAGQVVYVPLVNPTANIAPVPDVFSSGPCTGSMGDWTCANPCVTPTMTWIPHGNSPACAAYSMEAINNARSQLGENPLTLPSNWIELSDAEQLFVIADMERVSAGYPPYLGINATLSLEAQSAAALGQDPSLAPGFPTGTNPYGATGFDGSWAGTDNVLYADYMWMYDDGWGGSVGTTSNIMCSGPTSWACWGHRDNLLGSGTSVGQGVGLGCTTCEMGTAEVTFNGGGSLVDLIELPKGGIPPMTFTWADELAYFSPGDNPPLSPATTTVPPIITNAFHFTKLSFTRAGARLAWRVSPDGANAIDVSIYSEPGCVSAQTGRLTHPPLTHAGTIFIPARGTFVHGVTYWVRGWVTTYAGLTKSGCIRLGRV